MLIIQARKSIWWMPWHKEAKKDVIDCDKLGLAVNKLNPRFPNGETQSFRLLISEYIAYKGEPRELKHLST